MASLIAALFLLCTAVCCLAEEPRRQQVPESVDPAVTHLLTVVDGQRLAPFDPERVGPLIDFVLSPKAAGARYRPDRIDGATAAYLETDLDVSLEKLLKLTYNPRIPSHMTVPSTVRLSYWTEVGGARREFPELWHHLDGLYAPVRVDAVEAIVNTPDLFSGAYYAYLLDRTLILMRHRKKTVLLSLSMQRGPSDVGKKGVVVGPDRDWNYLYTGQKGISRTGLGWVDSYMYDSFSVTVYVETAKGAPRVRCGIFKWLRAGWAGINMVRPHHIAGGLERFFSDFKAILEAPELADADRLAAQFGRIEALPEAALRQKVRAYFSPLRKRCGADSSLCRRWFEEAFADGGHLARMNRKELEAVLCIETLKRLLGREHQVDASRFTAPSDPEG